MKLFIGRDFFDNPKPPRLFLCTTGKKIINELPAYELSGDFKWGSYSEAQFSIDRQYVDVLTGETKVHPAFDKTEGLRKVYMENIGYFVIQDPDTTYGAKDSKNISCFSSEYETANKYLENFRINTGEIDSKEVIALESIYGYNYTIDKDNLYKLATGEFDSYESYYVIKYTDNDSYTYEQISVEEDEYTKYMNKNNSTDSQPHERLYVASYPNVRFYWPTNPQLSFLHYIIEKIPGWKIGNVDTTLWRKERKFDEDRIAVYDFLMNEVQDTFDCVVEWDTLTNTINFYEEADDGITEDNTVQTRWETDVFISRDNLANEININYSTDDIKTKLKVSGADDLDIREVNLGKNYIMNLDYYHTLDWMEQDLFEAYDDYLDAVAEYTPQYTKAMQNWVGAYNKQNDLVNAVPAEGNVVLIGDEFKKLYCIHTPQYEEGADQATIDSAVNTATSALTEKLTLYHVNEDIKANNTDNYLLRLNNKNFDIATIRIYNANTDGTDSDRIANPDYKIQVTIVYAQSGITGAEKTYTMNQWIRGTLTAKEMGLEGYTVQYIGTMGAYFVLAKDEAKEATLEEYGVNLLREKHEKYTTIFQTQTEAMFSQEKYRCIAQSTRPDGDYDIGTRWLDTDSSPVVLKEYNGTEWSQISGTVSKDDQANYENYQRYIHNYEKLQAVQNVLLKKEKQATYMKNGYPISDRIVNINLYTKDSDGICRYNGQTLEGDLHRAAEAHFGLNTVVRSRMDQTLPVYYFTTSFDPATYIKNTELYSDQKKYYVKRYYYPYFITNADEFNKQTLYVVTSQNPDIYEEATEYDVSKKYYIKLANPFYALVDIDNKETFDKYDGTTDETTLYIMTGGNLFAVYLKGTTPYISYADSQGVYQATMDWITKETDFEKFFTEDQWIRLSPFIREDEFSDSNFLLTGYESEEERLEISKELFKSANKELNTLCQPSLEFSMEMANILALPEFKSLIDQFQLGNFVRVHIRDGYVKRARLLEVHLNFSDLSDFNCNFGNLVTTKSEIDKHAELLSQAVTAGKQVATSAGDWQKAVDKSNKLEQDIASGLQNAALEVGRASGQSIVWDSSGIWGRKLIDGTTDQYEDEQFRIINNKLVFSNDGFKTSKSVMGRFVVKDDDGNDVTRWGLLAEAMVGGYIEGSEIRGGTLRIGDGSNNYFQVSESGDVSIVQAGKEKYASVDAVKVIDDAYRYQIILSYDKSTIFGQPNQTCTLTCKVYELDEDITSKLPSGTTFSWLRNGLVYKTTTVPTLTVTNSDVDGNSIFACSVTFDETQIQ